MKVAIRLETDDKLHIVQLDNEGRGVDAFLAKKNVALEDVKSIVQFKE